MKILIDNGHGSNTPGKCSPDKRLREYAYCREIASRVVKELKAQGLDAELLVPETADVSITTRCKRVNDICAKLKAKTGQPHAKNVVLVSIHNNAARSDGKWNDRVAGAKPCTGFSVFCSKNASAASKKLAAIFTDIALSRPYPLGQKMTGNRSIPAGKFWTWSWTTQDIGILRNTNCPAVLTENFFQDHSGEVDWMLTEAGKAAIVKLHVDAIVKYVKDSTKQ